MTGHVTVTPDTGTSDACDHDDHGRCDGRGVDTMFNDPCPCACPCHTPTPECRARDHAGCPWRGWHGGDPDDRDPGVGCACTCHRYEGD